MTKYFLFTNTEGDMKLVNVDDIISITLDFTPYKQLFEIHVKGEAPCYFSIPGGKQIDTDKAVELVKSMMYNLMTQKHPVFDWEDFCKNRTKLGG